MRVALTIPSAGAGRWAWTGWLNAFKELGHEVIDLDDTKLPDLLICTTSSPQQERFLKWKKWNPHMKIALNVLALTDEDIPLIKNEGVQAHQGNIEYAATLKPDVVFAQYSPQARDILLKGWKERGYKLSSMMMAADSTVYKDLPDYSTQDIDYVYTGGFWAYKSQNITPYLLPLLKKFRQKGVLIGKGWPILTDPDRSERDIGGLFRAAKVCPNMHEPHSLFFEDIVERVFKTTYCGGLLLTDKAVGLGDVGFINGVNCLVAKSPGEYADIFEDVVLNPSKYAIIKQRGMELSQGRHTYLHRAKELLKDLL